MRKSRTTAATTIAATLTLAALAVAAAVGPERPMQSSDIGPLPAPKPATEIIAPTTWPTAPI